jgi:hypothetical protein
MCYYLNVQFQGQRFNVSPVNPRLIEDIVEVQVDEEKR